ncbi:hypothetical protein [Pseudomonas koreensis]|uniref:hypothetical protein n=1 Tax=Pseudomonas koreensis TaxID=198620 RepID=UPI001B31A971|nr:hypothetical protein [Pseudomonas koreensis]MBP3996948.1 hypothetical protein [Pseudomonas koreensis]
MNFFKKLLVSLKRPKTEDVEPTPQPLEVQEPDIYDSITEAEAANLRKMAEKWGPEKWGRPLAGLKSRLKATAPCSFQLQGLLSNST